VSGVAWRGNNTEYGSKWHTAITVSYLYWHNQTKKGYYDPNKTKLRHQQPAQSRSHFALHKHHTKVTKNHPFKKRTKKILRFIATQYPFKKQFKNDYHS
jgi:hypothetical protein